MTTVQYIPPQGIYFGTPTPFGTENLSMPHYKNFQFSNAEAGWQFNVDRGHQGWADFTLRLPCTQNVQMNLVMRSSAADDQVNNAVTLKVNSYQLLTNFNPHSQHFAIYTFFIPGHWLIAGANTLKLSIDDKVTTRVIFKSISVAGVSPQDSQATHISFEKRQFVDTDILSIVDQQGIGFNPSLNTWQISNPSDYITYRLYLDQPRLITLSMNFCSTPIPGQTTMNNPFNITVNGNMLVVKHDPHIQAFHDERWLVPINWVAAGDNNITVTLAGSATTTLHYRRFGAATQILPPRTSFVTLTHNNGRIEAKWPTMSGATTYQIDFCRGGVSKPVFTTNRFPYLKIAFPQAAQPGTYSVRVRPWADDIAGPWTASITVNLSRTILFLSSSGKVNPAAACFELERLGITVYANEDNLHIEALASDAQVVDARQLSNFMAAYAGVLTSIQITTLPPDLKHIAEVWNRELPSGYQQIVSCETSEDLAKDAPIMESSSILQEVPGRIGQAA
ncbi:hypothetical protein K461DRAFT_264918 [Myriangium duriaei CBS 260.36]|uniref:Uncharacterized protein n=1 Tax=Myriangium duriaei CBS 260.36 TaxID=1168546 RepID=A0A9P4MKD6_9PEZI|nr:hypothetical protein K461DRAFT_264918 [Myriangium duriaei CBS 260.36]